MLQQYTQQLLLTVRRHLLSSDIYYLLESDICYQIGKATSVIKSKKATFDIIKHYTYFDNKCRLLRFDNKCRFFKNDKCRLKTNVAIPLLTDGVIFRRIRKF